MYNTALKDTKTRSFRLHILNEELPSLTHLHKIKPTLYPSKTCPFCSSEPETNIHAITCPSLPANQSPQKLLENYKQSLINGISVANKKLKKHEIESQINNLSELQYWSEIMTSIIDNNITFIDIIRGYIPLSIRRLVKKLTHSSQKIKKIIYNAQSTLQDQIENNWHTRISKFLTWEESQGITTKRKKQKNNIRHQTNQQNNNIPHILHTNSINLALKLQTKLITHGKSFINNFFYNNFDNNITNNN